MSTYFFALRASIRILFATLFVMDSIRASSTFSSLSACLALFQLLVVFVLCFHHIISWLIVAASMRLLAHRQQPHRRQSQLPLPLRPQGLAQGQIGNHQRKPSCLRLRLVPQLVPLARHPSPSHHRLRPRHLREQPFLSLFLLF